MKKLLSFLLILFIPIFVFADRQISSPFYRWGGNYPLDNTTVYTNYEDAVKYAAGGKSTASAQDRSSAYKGQYIAVLENDKSSVYYIDDNWNLQEIGSGLIFHAGLGEDLPYDFDTRKIKDLYIKMDYDPSHTTTFFTNLLIGETNYLTLMIPQRGQRGADGMGNVWFDGWWEPDKSYTNEHTMVSYDGNLWMNLQPVDYGESEPTNNPHWKVMVARGSTGEKGDAGEITITNTITGEPGTSANVRNVGSKTNAILEFTIPQGLQGIPGLNLTYQGVWETNLYEPKSVVRHGTNLWYTENANETEPPGDSENKWKIFLQDGNIGPAGTISIGQVYTGLPKTSASITNIGTPENAILNFKIPQGEKGDPGNTFGIYSGAWDSFRPEYGSNTWFTYGNATYGVIQTFNPTAGSFPSNYIDSGEVVLLSKSGEDGKHGGQFLLYDEWSDRVNYKQFNMVRRNDAIYYCQSVSSSNQPPEDFENVWKLFVKDGKDAPYSIASTNSTWAGKFKVVSYSSNSLVYYDEPGYGIYYVVQDCPAEIIAAKLPSYERALNDENYFIKVVHYGKDGKNGDKGKDGKNGDPGDPGADGAGNMWFGGQWIASKYYETNTIVSWTNGSNGYALYASLQENDGIEPGVDINWKNYWQLLAMSGTNGVNGTSGVNYRFSFGWDKSIPYQKDDICIESNNFYLALQDAGGVYPEGNPDIWQKLISPDYRFYPTISSEEWSPDGIYQPGQLVRHNGSTWVVAIDQEVTIEPPSEESTTWAIFARAGDKGDVGPAIYPKVEKTVTLTPGNEASVTAIQSGTNVYYTFGIPQGLTGKPGVNLVYYDMWEEDFPYPTNSLVRWGTNLWYTYEGGTGLEPGILGDWSVYLSDGKAANVRVDPDTITLTNETDKAKVDVIPSGGGNDVILKFSIPKGEKGDRGYQGAPGVGLSFQGKWIAGTPYASNTVVRHGTNLWYTQYDEILSEPGVSDDWGVFLSDGPAAYIYLEPTETLPPSSNAYVRKTIIEDSPDVSFKFGIPQGIKGDPGDRGEPGAGVVYYGQFDPNRQGGYSSNSLVRYGTNLWFTTNNTLSTPGGPANDWIVFLSDGKPTKVSVSQTVEKLDSTNAPYVQTQQQIDGILLKFGIPSGSKGDQGDRGDPGAGLVYRGLHDPHEYEDGYPSNSLVRLGTNLWWNKEETTVTPGIGNAWQIFLSDGRPAGVSVVTNIHTLNPGEKAYITTNNPGGLENNLQLTFHIPKGDTGDTIYSYIESIVMLDPEAVPTTSYTNRSSTNFYTFGIPRGYQGVPGAGLVFFGDWKTNKPYSNQSLVRHGTNVWYYLGEEPTEIEPDLEDSPWKIFVADGKQAEVHVNPEVIPGTENEQPEVFVTPVGGGNDISIQFKIPQGKTGETGATITPVAKETVSLEYDQDAYVTNQIFGNEMNLYFGIPRGVPGVDAVYFGDWNPNGPDYQAKSMVRHGTNVWYTENAVLATVEPGTSDSPWKIFITDGEQGPQGLPANVTVTRQIGKLNPNETPYVDISPVGGGNDVNLTFNIPQGEKGEQGIPGVDLHYSGNYDSSQEEYSSNSMVHFDKMYWYATTNTTNAPSYESDDWKLFWKPMQITVSTNGETLEWDQKPQIITNYDSVNDIMNLSFKLPRGRTGVTKTPVPGNSHTVVPVSETQYGQARVEINTSLSDDTKTAFDFWIPAGLKGDKGNSGDNGTNATITVGGVSNVPPTELNTLGNATFDVVPGENNSYALYFGIPAGIKGDQGVQGLKGDNGVGLVPKGWYSTTNTYHTNEMVRFNGAQYYVNDTAPSEGISGKAPDDPDYGNYWTMFLQDGQSIAGDASTLVSLNELNIETQYLGKVLLDTNTLVVVSTNFNMQSYNMLTVVGGQGGGGSKQWEIDMSGNLMPAAEMYAGDWEYDGNEDIMPPAVEE